MDYRDFHGCVKRGGQLRDPTPSGYNHVNVVYSAAYELNVILLKSPLHDESPFFVFADCRQRPAESADRVL